METDHHTTSEATPIAEEQKALLAFEVAQAAKTQVTTWAKWILAVCGLILAILGIQYQNTMSQLDSRIDTAVNKRLDHVLKEKNQQIDQLTQRLIAQHIDALTTTRTESASAIQKLLTESDQQMGAIRHQSEDAIARFKDASKEVEAQRRLVVSELRQSLRSPIEIENSDYGQSKSGGDGSLLFELLPDDFLLLAASSTSEMSYEFKFAGEFRSTFAFSFLKAGRDRNADSNEDGMITFREAIAATSFFAKSLTVREQTPLLAGANRDKPFLRIDKQGVPTAAAKNYKLVVVGINEYDKSIRLLGCVNDAIAYRDFFQGLGFATDNSIELLLDANATQQNILRAISALSESATENDTVVFVFSGHIVDDGKDAANKSRLRAICPVDFDRNAIGQGKLPKIGDIISTLASSKAKQKLIIIN